MAHGLLKGHGVAAGVCERGPAQACLEVFEVPDIGVLNRFLTRPIQRPLLVAWNRQEVKDALARYAAPIAASQPLEASKLLPRDPFAHHLTSTFKESSLRLFSLGPFRFDPIPNGILTDFAKTA